MLTKLIGSAVALSLTFVPLAPVSYRGLTMKAKSASVLIHVIGREKDGKQRVGVGCSGTYIDSTGILTAAHCFVGYDPVAIWVRGPNDTKGYRVELVKLDKGMDLALLRGIKPHAYVTIGEDPQPGDDVLNIGSPLGFEFLSSVGIVAAIKFFVPEYRSRYVITTAMINSGSSGGGAFNAKGELIGVNTLSVGMAGWIGISLAVDGDTIRRFLA